MTRPLLPLSRVSRSAAPFQALPSSPAVQPAMSSNCELYLASVQPTDKLV